MLQWNPLKRVGECGGDKLQAEAIVGTERSRVCLQSNLTAVIAVTLLFLPQINSVGSFCDVGDLGGSVVTTNMLRGQVNFKSVLCCCRITVSGNVLLVHADTPACRGHFWLAPLIRVSPPFGCLWI